jgi:hypothetical protein
VSRARDGSDNLSQLRTNILSSFLDNSPCKASEFFEPRVLRFKRLAIGDSAPDILLKVPTVVSTVMTSTFSNCKGWLLHFFSSMMMFRNVVFGPIPFPRVPALSFAKFFVNHRIKRLLRRSHSNPQHVSSLLWERIFSTCIFLSPLDVGLRCAMQLCNPLFISPKQKTKSYRQMQQGRQTGLDYSSAAMPIAPPLNTAVEFQ